MRRNHQRSHPKPIPDLIIISSDDDDHDETSHFATPMVQINANAESQTRPLNAAAAATTTASNYQMVVTPKKDEKQIELLSDMESPCGLAQQPYEPYTINANNRSRMTILPKYPPKENTNSNHNNEDNLLLLLTNVPFNQLSVSQRASRRSGKYKASISIETSTNNGNSWMMEQYQTYYESLIPRLNIDFAILDYNYMRLHETIRVCHLAYKRTIFGRNDTLPKTFVVAKEESAQLLEFYLQIDVDLFYMKTCSFRSAQPCSTTKGIFCLTTPECLYAMVSCGRCDFCYIMNNPATKYQRCPIQFNLYQKHRFINGYESILNCPARCDTKNIIYVLTCLCKQYDYVGETNDTLWTRLSSHQIFIDRLIVEQLVGVANFKDCYNEMNTPEIIKKNRSRLYQHTKRCSQAIQAFLDVNNDYWIFIPMLNHKAEEEDKHYSTRRVFSYRPHNSKTNTYVANLPRPPVGYKFSKYQIEKQKEFFDLEYYKTRRNDRYTTCIGTMIAILPPNITRSFREIIHFLFVTHTESKLNIMGHIFQIPNSIPLNQGVWCANLQRHQHHQ